MLQIQEPKGWGWWVQNLETKQIDISSGSTNNSGLKRLGEKKNGMVESTKKTMLQKEIIQLGKVQKTINVNTIG